jgi:hydroxypyruvate reductase
MAKVLEENWSGPIEGLVITRYGHGVKCDRIEVVEAAHPVPDQQGVDAAVRTLARVRDLTEDDLVLALISGGGSSLLSVPAPGLTLQDKQAVNRALLASGATISEMNCVRKHLSAIKGGRLAVAAYPAQVVTLVISDVPGDDPSTIASGPTVGDPTTYAEAREIIDRYGIPAPAAVLAHLERGCEETPKPGDARLARAHTRIIAAPQLSLEAAAQIAASFGITPVLLGDSIEGEAREVGRVMAGMARSVVRHNQPVRSPCVLISGGETTVTVRGDGRGGRNVEFLLSLLVGLEDVQNVWAIACDTDGVDGSEEVAGAVIGPDTHTRAAALDLAPKAYLAANDGHRFFAALGDRIITGPTRTNVNDFRAILVLPAEMGCDRLLTAKPQ